MSEVEIVKFTVEDALAMEGSNELSNAYRLNQQTGPCYTAVHKGEIVGCCGVRIDGIGEVWASYSEKAKKDLKLSMLKQTKIYLDKIMREHALYRLWSESPIDKNCNFIEHMNFHKINAYLRG
jgi:hypothetical protein